MTLPLMLLTVPHTFWKGKAMLNENQKNLAFRFLQNIRKRLHSFPHTRCAIAVRWVLCGHGTGHSAETL